MKKILLVAAVLTAGCGESNPGTWALASVRDAAADSVADAYTTKDSGSVCTPQTCQSSGAECGAAPDGCGGALSCGSCPAGLTCGGGGPNRCGTNACAPKSCPEQGAECGTISDQCGAMISCGKCDAPKTCDAANRCTCSPASCGPGNCGQMSDGCGGTLSCGDCTSGQVCGGGGANLCGEKPCTPLTCP